MKKPSAQLHQLIQALTASEKRYFHIDAQRHALGGKNNYLDLFEIIADQQEYDDDECRVQFDPAINKRHFSVLKHQLYDRILKSLASFHQENSIRGEVLRNLEVVAVLIQKGLYDQAASRIKFLRTKCADYELTGLLPEVISLERQLITRQFFRNTREEKVGELLHAGQTTLKMIEREMIQWDRLSQIYRLQYERGSGGRAADRHRLETILADDVLNEDPVNEGTQTRLYYLQAHAAAHFMQGNAEKAIQYNDRMLDLLGADADKMQQYANHYLSVLNNRLIDCMMLGRYDEVKDGIIQMRSLLNDKAFKHLNDAEANIFRLSYQLELNYLLSLNRFPEAYLLRGPILKGLKKYRKSIVMPSVLTFHYLLAYTAFALRKYEESLDLLEPVLFHRHRKVVEVLQSFGQLLQLIIHFELENFTVLAYMADSVHHFQKTRKTITGIENTVLSYLRKLINAPQSEHPALWQQFHQALTTLKNSPDEQMGFQYFAFDRWALAHAKGKSFLEMLETS